MTELRSYNVKSIYGESVKCVIGNDLGVDKDNFARNTPAIIGMISQIRTIGGCAVLKTCNIRKDGEVWTPYLQIVEMLIRMGAKIGCVRYTGQLKADTLIEVLL